MALIPAYRRPEAGDHIYCRRQGGLYDHHGIYVGDDMVVHLQGKGKKLGAPSECNKCGNKRFINGEIAKVCIDCFLQGETVEIYEYGVPLFIVTTRKLGTCSSVPSKPPHEVIEAAVYYLEKGFAPYDLISNNCEHFAVYCKTGRAISLQVVRPIVNPCNIM
ncbi:lecithin retinol acyltransferase-like [Hibiscus syriacus]|uniref:lecithin retinol acyltransferase-like n=1 Tax=Hibiscus syriacus TaxID=106335 RepID=UPI0019225B74|nr:lecithin retinol acyltransferase-like [Hibiscus syriacus]XP_039064600.1 lecithin retinol acyltransferase-like [Hibiscus syriacus]